MLKIIYRQHLIFELDNWEDLKHEKATYPLFQKSRKDGYDGKGVQF